MSEPTAHEILLGHVMPDAEERAAFEYRARLSATVNTIVQTLENIRVELDIDKSELAERASMNSASVRRLLTQEGSNPEAKTLVQLADALGYDFALVARDNDTQPILFSMPEEHPEGAVAS